MTEIKFAATLDAPAARVWQIISSFHGIERWLPAIKASKVLGDGPGAQRICVLHDGAELHERLEELDRAGRRLRYAMTAGPLPITGYEATMIVREVAAERCELSWLGVFDSSADHEPAMIELFRGAYAAGAAGLQQLCTAG